MSDAAHPQPWEYLLTTDATQVNLDALGRDGWELVAVKGDAGDATLYFKRPQPSFRERVTLEQKQRYDATLNPLPTDRKGGHPEMKKGGIFHPGLSHLLASTGHTDYFMICDRGFPVPIGPERIDLALVAGIPTVLDVLCALIAEFLVDRVLIAQEMTEVSPGRVEELRALLGETPLEVVSHLALKRIGQTGRATVRTGDACPYANVIVVSG